MILGNTLFLPTHKSLERLPDRPTRHPLTLSSSMKIFIIAIRPSKGPWRLAHESLFIDDMISNHQRKEVQSLIAEQGKRKA